MAQPIWTTPAGSLGSFPANQLLSVQLVAQPVLPATSLEYVLIEEIKLAYSGYLADKLEIQYNLPPSKAESNDNAILKKLTKLCEESEDGYISWSQASANLRSFDMDVTAIKALIYQMVQSEKALVDRKSKHFTVLSELIDGSSD